MSSRHRRNYYTYMYADPLIPWGESTEAQRRLYGTNSLLVRGGLAKPFYVGKGKKGRMDAHWRGRNARSRPSAYNSYFYRYLRKMEREGREPVIVKIVGSLTEQEAHDEEVRSIRDIGRTKLGGGPLLNLTDGGEGSSGWIPSKRWRVTHSEAISGSKNPCFGKTGSEHPHFGKKHPEERKARMGEISRKRANRPSVKAQMRKRMLGNGNPAKRPSVQEKLRKAGKIRTGHAHQRALLLTSLVHAARADGYETCDEIKDYLSRHGVKGARGGPLGRSTVWYLIRRIDEGTRQPHKVPTGGKRNRYHLEKSKARTSNTLRQKTRKYLDSYGDRLRTAYQDAGGNYAAAAKLLTEREVPTFQRRGKWTNYRLKAMLAGYRE